jgi:hypothetical protein
MIVVKVELWSAVTGKHTEIGRMTITNQGTGTRERGNYVAKVMRRGSDYKVQREVEIKNYPRLGYQIWKLVSLALQQIYS